MSSKPISATILTLNEQDKIEACIRSLAWVDEVLVLDSGSTDSTVALADALGARVITERWHGYAKQKNLAAERAKHDWIFNVDADERVTAELAASTLSASRSAAGYSVERKSDFMGIVHRPVHRAPRERLVRFYDRTRAGFDDVLVHEKVVSRVTSETLEFGELTGLLMHCGYRSYEDFIARLNRYSGLLAAESTGSPVPSWIALLGKPIARLAWDLIAQRNILDGRRGFIISASWAFHDFMVAAKEYEQQLDIPDDAFAASRRSGVWRSKGPALGSIGESAH